MKIDAIPKEDLVATIAGCTIFITTWYTHTTIFSNWGSYIGVLLQHTLTKNPPPLTVNNVLPTPYLLWRNATTMSDLSYELNKFYGACAGIILFNALIITKYDLIEAFFKITWRDFGLRMITLWGAHIATYTAAKHVLQTLEDWNRLKLSLYQLTQLLQTPTSPIIQKSAEECTSQELKDEASFTAELEKKARTWYAYLPQEKYETCPICYEVIEPKNLHITRCKQNRSYSVHIYCNTCIKTLKKCPICRGTMLYTRITPSQTAKNPFNSLINTIHHVYYRA